ncbi:PQQ-binding-like beta-propeller repeat protein [Glycomyces tarimensis]
MSASASYPGRNQPGTQTEPGRHRSERPGPGQNRMGRPLGRIFLRTAGLTALIAWAAMLVWASFGTEASAGSSGPYMIFGTVASVLWVAVVVATAVTRSGLRVIIAAFITVVAAAAAGWAVYSAMPEAGPDSYITHRAGVAAMSYGFGVVGAGLLALSEFVVEGYSGGRVAPPRRLRRKVAVLAAALVVIAAAALAPAMQQWAELANQDSRVGDAAAVAEGASAGAEFDSLAELAGVERFVKTRYGMLRVDHPASPTPQAVTLLDPATGTAAWYHRRWNWYAAQDPVLSQAHDLIGLSGPRADNPDDYQTRVLRTETGEEVATADFNGAPGVLMALSDDRLVYAEAESEVFGTYDFSGERLWEARMPAGCEGTAAQITGERLAMVADCLPAPNRTEARDWILAFDLDDGDPAWEMEIEQGAEIIPENFLVTEDAIIIDSRVEQRVSDGPFSARHFEHELIALDAATGKILWSDPGQKFGSTHSSACGGTLHLSYPTAIEDDSGEAGQVEDDPAAHPSVPGAGHRTVQLVECYAVGDGEGSRLGIMAYDLETGQHLYSESVRLGFTPLDPEVTRGWATVLPDNRALLASDLSLDQNVPDCRLFEVQNGRVTRLEIDQELPPAWCRDAQLTAVAGGVAISYVNDEGTRGIAMVS